MNIKRHKLIMIFLFIFILFLSTGIITINGLFTLGNLTKKTYKHPLAVSNASLIAALNISKMHHRMHDIVLANSADEREIALEAIAENEHTVYQQLTIIQNEVFDKKGQALEAQTRQLFANWKPIRQAAVLLLKSGDKKDALLLTKEKGTDQVVKLETKLLELTSYARKKADGFLKSAEASQTRLKSIIIILILSGILLYILIAFIATHPVRKAKQVLQEEKNKLQKALDEIKSLRGIIPICSHCKQMRDDKGLWKKMEDYIHAHSDATFSHSICPDCAKQHYSEYYNSNNPDEEHEK